MGCQWNDDVAAIATMWAKQRTHLEYDRCHNLDTYTMTHQWKRDFAVYLDACRAASVCRYPFCWQPCDWTGADLDADPNAGGWCQHHG